MAAIQWTDALALGLPFLDRSHERCFALLAQAQQVDDGQLEAAWRALLGCMQENFEREDRWMQSTGFACAKPHGIQHRVVLQVMNEGLLQAREGKVLQVREMARQLGPWLVKHIQTMDAALALHLRGVGFDPADPPAQDLAVPAALDAETARV